MGNNRRKKYNRFSTDMEQKFQQYVPQEIACSQNELAAPTLNVEGLNKLADFLDSQKNEVGFPEVTVIPDVLRNVGKFVNERKRMKYSHQEFEKKMKFLSEGVDKQYHVAMATLQKNTELSLAQINGNIQQSIMSIQKYYDVELQKINHAYRLKSEEMNLYYQNLEAQRREQARRFDKMIKIATIERKRASKAIKEAEQICNFLINKMCEGTASREEREFYMELLRLRVNGANSIANIIPQLANKIY